VYRNRGKRHSGGRSGNAPVIRIMAEGADAQAVEAGIAAIRAAMAGGQGLRAGAG
jgi:hypothetical protein